MIAGDSSVDFDRRNELSNEWDRQRGESPKAFAAFVIYRDLEGNRSLQDVANKLRCSRANIARWASKWQWYDRAREWDIHRDQLHQEGQIRERVRMGERVAREGMALQALAIDALQRLQEQVRQGEYDLSPLECARLMEIGARLESSVRGEPDKQQFTKIEVIVALDDPEPDDPVMVAAAAAAAAPRT